MKCLRGVSIIFCAVVFFALSNHPVLAYVNWGQCKIQTGESTILANTATVSVTLSPSVADISKAFVLVNTSGQTALVNADTHMATAYISNSTTVIVDRVGSPATALPFTYQVVYCPNNEFSVQTGTITIASGSSSGTATISSVDTTKSLVIVSSRSTDTTANESTGLAYGYLSDSTTVTAARAATSTVTPTVRFQVVTFSTESGVTLQTGNINFTGNVASATATISSVTTSRAWLYCSWNSASNTMRAVSVGCDLTNATTVTVNRHVATNYTNAVQYTVIQFPVAAAGVQRGIVVNNDPDNGTNARYDHDITITALSSLNASFPYATQTVNGIGAAYPRNLWIYQLTSTTNVRGSFFNGDAVGNGDQNSKYWQVVEFLVTAPPTVQSVTSQSVNPTLAISSYGGSATHTATSWKVIDTNNCKTGSSVWESLDNATSLTSVVVNTTNGSFMGARNGQTTLGTDTVYYVCAYYTTTGGSSDWSSPYYFSTNILPSASSANMMSGALSFTPVAGTTNDATGLVTITDTDSCQDIASVSGVFFQTSQTSVGSPDGGFRYFATCTLNSGTCTGGGDTTATYTCSFPVQYYAHPTDSISQEPSDNWTFLVTPADELGNGSTASDTIEMNTLAALSLSSSINFGTLSLGADTGSTNQTITLTNVGNARLDVDIAAYGSTPGDNKAMQCTLGSVAVSLMKYFTAAFTYGSGGTVFSSSSTELNLNIMSVGLGTSSKSLYTGVKIPDSSVDGSCAGNISINAIYDSIND